MKDVNSLRGIHSVGTMQSRKKRSISRVQSSTYLDLYMLKKEKERLLKENAKLSMRADDISRRLGEIDQETRGMHEAEGFSETGANKRLSGHRIAETNGVKKEFKTMSLSY